MAYITAYTPLDMTTFMDWRGGAPVLVSPTQVTYTDGETTAIVLGQFTESDGRISGILTGYEQLHGSTIDVIIGDLNQGLPFELVFPYIVSGQGDYVLQMMMGASDMVIVGTSGNDVLLGHSGNDAFTGGAGDDTIMGGGGFNKAQYSDAERAFTITVTADSNVLTVQHRGPYFDGTDTLSDIQQLVFEGTVSNVDPSRLIKAATLDEAHFGDLTELYVAYFNRAPDAYGLYYWASRLVEGMSMKDIAQSFFAQPETQASLPSSLSTQDFVTKVYANVLGRAPDQAGFDYWVNDLQSGKLTRDVFMLAIINGAKVPNGNARDAQYLANKETVGEHFALDKGLGDADWAKQVMAHVDVTSQSVAAANQMTDAFAAQAVTTDNHLLIPLVGLPHAAADQS